MKCQSCGKECEGTYYKHKKRDEAFCSYECVAKHTEDNRVKRYRAYKWYYLPLQKDTMANLINECYDRKQGVNDENEIQRR